MSGRRSASAASSSSCSRSRAKPLRRGSRVAVNGRRTGAFIAQTNTRFLNDGVFVTALDPAYIKLDGPYTSSLIRNYISFPGTDTGADLNSYITIAPDWEGIPANASYRLSVAGQPSHVIATTPAAADARAALRAGRRPDDPGSLANDLADVSGIGWSPRDRGVDVSVDLRASRYQFAARAGTARPSRGQRQHDSRRVRPARLPEQFVTRTDAERLGMPGIGNLFFQGFGLYPYYTVPLASTSGTVDIPVAALAGAGTYTLWIDLSPGLTAYKSDISDLAFARVDAGTARPPARSWRSPRVVRRRIRSMSLTRRRSLWATMLERSGSDGSDRGTRRAATGVQPFGPIR